MALCRRLSNALVRSSLTNASSEFRGDRQYLGVQFAAFTRLPHGESGEGIVLVDLISELRQHHSGDLRTTLYQVNGLRQVLLEVELTGGKILPSGSSVTAHQYRFHNHIVTFFSCALIEIAYTSFA